jgi:very-short-patch-repair endonuclease
MAATPAQTETQAITDLLRRQHLLITRQQAHVHGLSDSTIYYRSGRGGRWRQLLPGVFLTVAGTPTADQRDAAALLYCGPSSTLTCGAALRQYELRDPDPGRVHVLVPAGRQRLSSGYVIVHRTRRLPPRVCVSGPLRYVLPARAVADAVREISSLSDVRAVVAGAIQSGHCTVDQLRAELESGSVRWSASLRLALAEVASGARSAPEAELMELIRRSGLPEPLFNPRLYVGTRYLARPDVWWPDAGVAVEVDSREWHLSPDSWEQTMRRHARMTAAGILVLHFTPRQIKTEPAEVLATITAALCSRRGLPAPLVLTKPA